MGEYPALSSTPTSPEQLKPPPSAPVSGRAGGTVHNCQTEGRHAPHPNQPTSLAFKAGLRLLNALVILSLLLSLAGMLDWARAAEAIPAQPLAAKGLAGEAAEQSQIGLPQLDLFFPEKALLGANASPIDRSELLLEESEPDEGAVYLATKGEIARWRRLLADRPPIPCTGWRRWPS